MLKAADPFEASERDIFALGGVVESAMKRLSQGYRSIIVPESTHLVITCGPRWVTRENSFLNPPVAPRMRIRGLEPVDPRAEGSSSRTLRDMISARVRTELGMPVSGRAPGESEVKPG